MAHGRRRQRRKMDANVPLNIVSLMDLLTIMLFFLIMNYSVDQPYMASPDLKLPKSNNKFSTVDALKLSASKNAVSLGTEKIADIKNGELFDPQTGKRINEMELKMLRDLLAEEEVKAKKIAELNPEKKFEGNLVLEADGELPYAVIKRLIYTAGRSNYAMFKFATTNNK